jgi:hypothetical protein
MMAAMRVKRYQNSYRLNPTNPFNRKHVKLIMKKIMDRQFVEVERFASRTTPQICREVSDEIIEKIKENKYDR